VTEVPEQYRSKTPAKLRSLAQNSLLDFPPAVREALQEAAAEIEGSEEAYAVLVGELRELREKHERTQENLRSAYSQIPQRSM